MPHDFLEMDVAELERWKQQGKEYTLLDVRLASELDLASVPGALHIPMRDVQARIREIPRDRPVVVMCHVGERSARIARFLVTDGFAEVYNLEGGIDDYALRVDQSVARY
ncbi:MAG TPA: rhodanese-like domain-containing protein [Candidatus Acidoferrales bacterium]|nr:rhodanese-like domain-containing protein [Candidatus Acidoferrales bacterium]